MYETITRSEVILKRMLDESTHVDITTYLLRYVSLTHIMIFLVEIYYSQSSRYDVIID